MKKISLLLLSALLLVQSACLPVFAEDAQPDAVVRGTHLTVANPTPVLGQFFTDLWATGTADIDVRTLLSGCNLVCWDGIEGLFRADPSVVSSLTVTENAAGDRTYTFTILDGLRYSDGTRITAWDYAFSVLFQISPEIRQLGGTNADKSYLTGFDAYMARTAAYLSGVRVLNDNTIAFTVSHEFLPYFYELALVSCEPMPISAIAPGVVVRDDGFGVYLANQDPNIWAPVYSTDLLSKTLLDPENGFLHYPYVSSGPYTLTSWDGVTATFAYNPYYRGNALDERPLIETLTYTLADNRTMMENLEKGVFDVVNKVTDAEAISKGLQLTTGGDFRMANYPRSGMSFLSFVCENRTVSSVAVRQAIAWCMDRDAITSDYTGGYGLRVDGFYGLGQWMFRILSGAVDPPVRKPDIETEASLAAYQEKLDQWSALSLDSLTPYTADVRKANALLDADGWVVNPSTGIREKWVDGYLTPLDLTLAYPDGSRIAACFEQHMVPYLAACGVRLTLLPLPTQDLFLKYYGRDSREADGRQIDMFFLGSNFSLIYDPVLYFSGTDQFSGGYGWRYTGYQDDDLYNLAVSMRETEPGNVLEYMREWIVFQQRFNEKLPMIPIYSNVYFDFYVSNLERYTIAESTTWADAMLGAYLAETK